MPELGPGVVVLPSGQIVRLADDIVAAEQASFRCWAELGDRRRAVLLACIRRQLLRLLAAPDWVPGSLHVGMGDQLHVNFVVQFDEDTELDAVAEDELRRRLVDMAAHLGSS
jgi:hypothetical protein